MRAFAQLFTALDSTTRTSEKLAALEDYFRNTPPADAAWGLWFLSGRRLKRAVRTAHLRQCVAEVADLPMWLVDQCHEHVGDLAETLALLLPANPHPRPPVLSQLVEQSLLPLARSSEAEQRRILRATWAELNTTQCFLWHKLITGDFRVGVSRALVVRALASLASVDPAVMSHRVLGDWRPTPDDLARLLSGEAADGEPARPYPFYLASPIEDELQSLGDVKDWQFEWKWDGIRAQLLRREGEAILWSRGEEMVTPAFPEIARAALALSSGTVLDGELLAWLDDAPLPFAQLQRRLNRRDASVSLQREVPVVFMAYDVLESAGQDIRNWALVKRREHLEQILARAAEHPNNSDGAPTVWTQGDLFAASTPASAAPVVLRVSPLLPATSWQEVANLQEHARAIGAEGLMLKRSDSAYGAGRQRGAWWKWKVAPFTCDAVLVAAQPGHGRRATLFTDYTFAVREGEELVPVAKAYSGLSDEEINRVDAFVRANTMGRFGPVRSVKPTLVFELAFEGIAPSTRHKAGLALRFPRIARWRHDKKPEEADSLEALRRLASREGERPREPKLH